VWDVFHGLRVQDVKSLILIDALFLLDQGRRREGKKKEKEKESPWGNLLAVLQITTVQDTTFKHQK
jgi:hypothetical protein